MEQVLIRKLPPGTRADYRAAAEANGRSMEAELREVIERNRPKRRLTPQEREAMARRLTANQQPQPDSASTIHAFRQRMGARSGS